MILRTIAIVILLLESVTGAQAGSAQQLYVLNCWGCHRPNGEGIPGVAPPLIGAADFLRVPGGREYLIKVPGVSESALNDAEVAEVMNWVIVSLNKNRVPATFAPYTADEVKRYRSERLLDVVGTRKALVAKLALMKTRPTDQH